MLKRVLPLIVLALLGHAVQADTLLCKNGIGQQKDCSNPLQLANIPTLDAAHLPFSLPLSRVNGGVGADISALGTGFFVQTAPNAWAVRSIVAGSGITVTHGSGGSANPSVALTSNSVTVAAGNGLSASGCGPVALGGTCTLSATTSNRQTFTAAGTWTKPAYCTLVILECLGAGGGGGSGGRGTTKSGGSGGWGGSYGFEIVPCASLNATESVVIGAPTAAATAITADNTDGNLGTQGGDSYVQHGGAGFLAFGQGGSGGVGGTTANPTPLGTGAFASVLRAVAPGPGNLAAGKQAGAGIAAGGSEAGYYMAGTKAGGSGGGGGGTNGGSSSGGGIGSCPGAYGTGNFNLGGSAPGGNGATGRSSTAIPISNVAGCGGGGGASAGDGSTAGGAGGNGDGFGAGGGGGGASANGANSGRGGQASGGICWLSTF